MIENSYVSDKKIKVKTSYKLKVLIKKNLKMLISLILLISIGLGLAYLIKPKATFKNELYAISKEYKVGDTILISKNKMNTLDYVLNSFKNQKTAEVKVILDNSDYSEVMVENRLVKIYTKADQLYVSCLEECEAKNANSYISINNIVGKKLYKLNFISFVQNLFRGELNVRK